MYAQQVGFEGRVRRILIGPPRSRPSSDWMVLPHERTHRGPKEDRLALLRATRVSLEPLWFLYEGAGTGVPAVMERGAARGPAVTFTGPQGTGHRPWVVSDPALHRSVHSPLAGLPGRIPDGHHPDQTAL